MSEWLSSPSIDAWYVCMKWGLENTEESHESDVGLEGAELWRAIDKVWVDKRIVLAANKLRKTDWGRNPSLYYGNNYVQSRFERNYVMKDSVTFLLQMWSDVWRETVKARRCSMPWVWMNIQIPDTYSN